ncbi:MAG: peptidylprolyl isomerase [Rhodomicrobium sp.]|nr:MAG: peptidylprolyl isomerase [Rhodomicrobium sp.]
MNTAVFPDLIVNGTVIPRAVVAAETQNQEAPKGKPRIAWQKAANAIAIRTLLLEEARARGVLVDSQEVGPGRFESDEEAQIRGLLEQAVSVTRPDEKDVKAEWQKDPSRFRTPPLWEVSHILCVCDPRDLEAREKARARITDIAATLAKDPKGFEAIAARESECGSKGSGGALGQLGPGDTVPEFEAVLRTLSEGETTSEPIITRHGYHIIRLDALAEGQVLPFEAVSEKIAEAMEKAAWAKGARNFVDELIKGADIKGADFISA